MTTTTTNTPHDANSPEPPTPTPTPSSSSFIFMHKGRLEAFSDGVLAIIITIMVLDMRAPHDAPSLADLQPVLPVFLSYILSYVYLGIYWTNHHHMFQVTRRVTGGILWANLHLLFWLSLIPFATAWLGNNHFAATPAALYGFILLMAACAYFILQGAIIRDQKTRERKEERKEKHEAATATTAATTTTTTGESVLATAIGRDLKGKVSPILYILGIIFSYFASPWLGCSMYILVALIWLVPDRRIEQVRKDLIDR